MSVILTLDRIHMTYGEKEVLKGVHLEIEQGERIGIVGRNGAGKTTLAQIISGSIKPTRGQMIWQGQGQRLSYLRQSSEQTGFGVPLSGGEQTKKALQQVFYSEGSLMLLDEPTNHLDEKGIKWLIKEIENFNGTILFISHDRFFLDQCAKRIIELEEGQLKSYKGNYTYYQQEKKKEYEIKCEQYRLQEQTKAEIQGQIKQLSQWSNKAHQTSRTKAVASGNKFGGKEYNRVKAKKRDRQVKSKMNKLEKLEIGSLKQPKKEKGVYFAIDEGNKTSRFVAQAQDISKSYGKKTLFKASSFYIQHGEHFGVYGENGCGKSTLIKAMLGQVAVEGSLKLSDSKRIGYMSQDVMALDETKSIKELFTVNSKLEETKLRNSLALMGFGETILLKRVGCLSLGERMKLKLLQMINEGCEVLLLDEPTNHVDLFVRAQLEETLAQYEGTIILVTHDRYMLSQLCDKLLIFENQQILRYEYGIDTYLERQHMSREKKNSETIKVRQMVIENKLAYLIGQLSKCPIGSETYNELDKTYQQLIKEKQALK